MQATCPACSRTLQLKPELAGKKVKCLCGHAFAVPASASTTEPKAAAATSGNAASPSVARITVDCQCGKRLQVPATAAGKAVRCQCGKAIPVPAAPLSNRSQTPSNKKTANMAAVSAPAAGGFHSLSDDEWSSLLKAPPPPPSPLDKPKKSSNTVAKALNEAQKDLKSEKVGKKSAAKDYLNSSRAILYGLGAIRIALSLYFFMDARNYAETLLGEGDEEIIEFLAFIIQVLSGIQIGIGVLFIVFGIFASFLPLTCTISAFVLFTILEIVGLLMNPLDLFSIRSWVIRCAIGGALLQAINNAAYYKYVRRQMKAEEAGLAPS